MTPPDPTTTRRVAFEQKRGKKGWGVIFQVIFWGLFFIKKKKLSVQFSTKTSFETKPTETNDVDIFVHIFDNFLFQNLQILN